MQLRFGRLDMVHEIGAVALHQRHGLLQPAALNDALGYREAHKADEILAGAQVHPAQSLQLVRRLLRVSHIGRGRQIPRLLARNLNFLQESLCYGLLHLVVEGEGEDDDDGLTRRRGRRDDPHGLVVPIMHDIVGPWHAGAVEERLEADPQGRRSHVPLDRGDLSDQCILSSGIRRQLVQVDRESQLVAWLGRALDHARVHLLEKAVAHSLLDLLEALQPQGHTQDVALVWLHAYIVLGTKVGAPHIHCLALVAIRVDARSDRLSDDAVARLQVDHGVL
mmetsp:Transcript_7863/g.18394  ORF Transcript_7863/g.18394 Transcript_7863/m.18394 type:complete len:279 (-) Transcript_7863:13-849(-)